MKQYLNFLLLIVLTIISPISARAGKVQKFNNKGITDLNDIKIRSKTKKLIIKSNPIISITDFTLPDNLQSVTFDSNTIDSVNGLIFGENLKTVSITFNSIKNFKNIQFNNNLKELEICEEFVSLAEFDLSNTSLKELSLDAEAVSLDGLVLNDSIEVLNLSNNYFTSVANFEFPMSLTEINLSSNMLSSFDGQGLNPNLESLDLSQNEFPSYSGVVNLPQSLSYLGIGGFSDSRDFSDLVFPDSLETLSITNALLTENHISSLTLPTNLKKLLLINNNLGSLGSLELPSSLRLLDLRGNQISNEEKSSIIKRFKTENPNLKIKI